MLLKHDRNIIETDSIGTDSFLIVSRKNHNLEKNFFAKVFIIDNKKEKPARTKKSASAENIGSRRRGEVLEAAIIEAAWDELSDVGYDHLTMETIAKRAKTSKAVLYRRWPNKYNLVIAALRKHLPKPFVEVPNTGDLRNDVYTLLHEIVETLHFVNFQTIYGLLNEYRNEEGKNLFAIIPQILHQKTERKKITPMMAILKNAEARNEIVLEKINSRIITLPLDLLRYEIITVQEPIPDKTIIEIVDEIFMPLVKPYMQTNPFEKC